VVEICNRHSIFKILDHAWQFRSKARWNWGLRERVGRERNRGDLKHIAWKGRNFLLGLLSEEEDRL